MNTLNDTARFQIAALMIRIKAGELQLVDEAVEIFNNRKMDRRDGAYTIKGWEVIES